MLLMPVHILFLQLIIDPACSVVFEAEPLEAEAMRGRRGDRMRACSMRRSLTRPVARHADCWRCCWRCIRVRAASAGSDETARALTFTVLVVSNLALIYVNRTWTRHHDSSRPWNAAFGWIASATCVLLVLVLWVPAVGGLFLFTTPSASLLLIGMALCLGALAWFEATKWLVGQRAR